MTFYSASQCVPRRHKINTEVNERLLKNIGTHWNIRHRWFQQVPISFSLALDRFVAKFSKSGSYMGLVYQIAYTEKCLHFWWYLNSYNTVSNRQKKTSTTEASSMRPVVSTQCIKGKMTSPNLRSRHDRQFVGITRYNALSLMAQIYRVIRMKLNHLV